MQIYKKSLILSPFGRNIHIINLHAPVLGVYFWDFENAFLCAENDFRSLD